MSWIIFEVWKVSHKVLYVNIRFNKNFLSQISQRPNNVDDVLLFAWFFPVLIFLTFLKHPNISSPVVKFSYTRVNMKTVLSSLVYIEIYTRHRQKVLLHGGILGGIVTYQGQSNIICHLNTFEWLGLCLRELQNSQCLKKNKKIWFYG